MSNEVLTLDQLIARIRAEQPAVTVVEDATGPVVGDPHRPDDRAEFLSGYHQDRAGHLALRRHDRRRLSRGPEKHHGWRHGTRNACCRCDRYSTRVGRV